MKNDHPAYAGYFVFQVWITDLSTAHPAAHPKKWAVGRVGGGQVVARVRRCCQLQEKLGRLIAEQRLNA